MLRVVVRFMKNNEDVTNLGEESGDDQAEEIWEEVLEKQSETLSTREDAATTPINVPTTDQAILQHNLIPGEAVATSTSTPFPVSPRSHCRSSQQSSCSPGSLTNSKSSSLYQSLSAWPLAEREATLLMHYVLKIAPWVC